MSTAVLARRKMGKTAIMERLFNITFFKNDGVIPFYYEIKEVKKWVGDFCVDFFLTFVYQYIAFKTRNIDYLTPLEKNDFFKSITRYLPEDFNFCRYSRVWKYDFAPEYSRRINIDIFARSTAAEDYSIIGEVKSREHKKFSKDEVVEFEKKFSEVKKLEKIDRAIGLIFSRSGFTKEAEDYCKEKGIACSEDERWLESG
ncbi:MAG: hypothetical protein PVH61_32675 [Candidatus Aminicenantes bacterium]|jgi:hypothetical protein